jgi:hypothetical protein
VIEGASEVEVEFFVDRNRFHPARILGVEGGDPAGLAALLVQGAVPADAKALALDADAPVQPGEPVLAIGFPRAAAPYAVTRGEIVGRRGKLIDVSGAIEEGNSGGPLIKDGQVIGVILEARAPFAHALPAVIAHYVLESWAIDVRARAGLRSTAASVPAQEVARTIAEHAFSHPGVSFLDGMPRQVAGRFKHSFETKTINGANVVIDHATGLVWQQSGSSDALASEEAPEYIEWLNGRLFAGASDWRLPTIEELASLIESRENVEGAYASELFDSEKWKLWSADLRPDGDKAYRWGVDFARGVVDDDSVPAASAHLRWVRGVRSK